MQITKDLRFVFDREDGQILVKDQMAQGHRWTYTQTNPPTDFAIVSRIFDSKSGELVIVAAGLSHFGTQVAGEFLTNPAYLEEALRGAPPKVLASHYW